MGSVDPDPGALHLFHKEDIVNDIIVFVFGLFVSALVVYGIFSRVVSEMHEAKFGENSVERSENG
jgi:hypothetical protein